MDHRAALERNTELFLNTEHGEAVHCVIENEIGRGGSCIVYEASRITTTGDKTLYRVKEYYPYKFDIKRDEHGRLISSAKDTEAFRRGMEQFLANFSRTNRLFYSDSNYASMVNQLDVFRQNGTLYILSAYSSRRTLAEYKPESLKECITLVKQVACVLGNIHQQGFLYLDIKPDNVLVLDGLQTQIQLFDFDSLFSMRHAGNTGKPCYAGERLSYSKGFAPIELQTSKIRQLGPCTDIYGVGALLYFLLFGRTPAASDCEMDADYNFNQIQYDYRNCDDRLFEKLKDLFHNTLAVYYADRYQNMEDVVKCLQELEVYSNQIIPRIFSSRITRANYFHGRERELYELDQFMENRDCNCLFITGMGGIGKSALIREYLATRRYKFDTILYAYFKGSVEATIADDRAVEINTLSQSETEITGNLRYFDKKLLKIRELVRGTASVLVIDNFSGEIDGDLGEVLNTDLKVVLLCREAPVYQNSRRMTVTAISDRKVLRKIFEDNLGRVLEDDELDDFRYIAESVAGHTLVLELIVKQIACSYISLQGAADLIDEHGFSAIAPEKVEYEKDSRVVGSTIGNIIDAIFETGALSVEKKRLMKVASLLGDDGMNIHLYQKIMKLDTKDELNELLRESWLMTDGDRIFMHPVIREAVCRWEWTKEYMDAAGQFLKYFYVEIRLESTKNNYPKKLRNHLKTVYLHMETAKKQERGGIHKKIDAYRADNLEQTLKKEGLVGEIVKERCLRVMDDTPADMDKLERLLLYAEDILEQCKRDPVIKNGTVYRNLLYLTVLHVPPYKEDYVLKKTKEILEDKDIESVLKEPVKFWGESEDANAATIVKLCARAALIYADHGRYEDAMVFIGHAKDIAWKVSCQKVFALYYDLLGNYYDILLNGEYDTEDPDGIQVRSTLISFEEKTLVYSKKGVSHDEDYLYIKNLLAKAVIRMRSETGTEKEINSLINAAENMIEKYASQYADVRFQYDMIKAWQSALMYGDESQANIYIERAREKMEKVSPTDEQMIEELIIPCANIYYELRCFSKAIDFLYEGLQICRKHMNVDAYARIRQELCEHLLEVGIAAEEFDFCQDILDQIDYDNEEIVDDKNQVYIPDEVQCYIEGNCTI